MKTGLPFSSAIFFIIFAIIIPFGAIRTANADTPEQAKALYDAACKYEKLKQFQKAKETYIQVSQQFPGCPYYDTARVSAARADVLNTIETGADAQSAIDKLIADFNQSPDLPKTLYAVAERYERKKMFDKASVAYQQLGQKCPDSSFGRDAQLDVQKINILSAIESGSDPQEQIDRLQSDFATSPALPKALYRIAERYEGAQNPIFDQKAAVLYQKIVQTYPGNDYAAKAALDAAKMDAAKAIMAGADDQNAVERMVSDFSGNAGLPAAVYCVARRYAEMKKFDKARDAYQLITERFGQSAYSSQALILNPTANILHIIQTQGATAEAQAQMDKLISDFSSSAYLAEALYSIAQRCRNSPKPDYAKAASVYRKIAADYPSTGYAEKAKVYTAAVNTMAMIDSLSDGEANQAAMERINASLADMNAVYAANPGLCGGMLAVAEKCYTKGLSQMHQNPQNALPILFLCCDILENSIIGRTSNKYFNAQVYYKIGLNYQNLGDYLMAADAFESSYQIDPNFQYAFYCLYAAGNCLDKARRLEHLADINEADVENAYVRFVEAYSRNAYSDCALMRLGEMMFESGQYVKALGYLGQFYMTAEPNDLRMIDVKRKLEYYGRRIENEQN